MHWSRFRNVLDILVRQNSAVELVVLDFARQRRDIRARPPYMASRLGIAVFHKIRKPDNRIILHINNFLVLRDNLVRLAFNFALQRFFEELYVLFLYKKALCVSPSVDNEYRNRNESNNRHKNAGAAKRSAKTRIHPEKAENYEQYKIHWLHGKYDRYEYQNHHKDHDFRKNIALQMHTHKSVDYSERESDIERKLLHNMVLYIELVYKKVKRHTKSGYAYVNKQENDMVPDLSERF
jgi:hypothetical protein